MFSLTAKLQDQRRTLKDVRSKLNDKLQNVRSGLQDRGPKFFRKRPPQDLRFVDCLADKGPKLIEHNGETGVPLQSEHFEGQVLLVHKYSKGDERGGPHSAIFHKKRWLVEVQIQGKLLKPPPPGRGLFWSVELGPFDQLAGSKIPIKPTMKKYFLERLKIRAGVKALQYMAKGAGLQFRYSLGATQIRPHVASSWEDVTRAYPIFWASAGEPPPPLGLELHKWAAEKAGSTSVPPMDAWPDHTFTAAFRTKHLDFRKWRVKSGNLSGLLNVNLKSLIGTHAVHLALIEADMNDWEDIKDMQYHIDLAVINTREHENDLMKIINKEAVQEEDGHSGSKWVSIFFWLACIVSLCCAGICHWEEREIVNFANQVHVPRLLVVRFGYVSVFMSFAFLFIQMLPGGSSNNNTRQRRNSKCGASMTLAAPSSTSGPRSGIRFPWQGSSVVPRLTYRDQPQLAEFHEKVAYLYSPDKSSALKAPSLEDLRKQIDSCLELLWQTDSALLEISRPLGVPPEPLDDVFWGRLLVATHFDIRQAVNLAEEYLKWRRSTNGGLACPLRLFDGKLFAPCTSKDGFPILVFRTRYHDSTLPVSVTEQGFRGLLDAVIARHLLARPKGSSSVPINVLEQYIIIIDLQGFSKANFDQDVIKMIKKETEKNYPEFLHLVCMINVPSVFTLFWRLLTNLLDPRTVKKYKFLGKNDIADLKKFMHDKDIPASLGGSGEEWPLPTDMSEDQRLGIFRAVLEGALKNTEGPPQWEAQVWEQPDKHEDFMILFSRSGRAVDAPPESAKRCSGAELLYFSKTLPTELSISPPKPELTNTGCIDSIMGIKTFFSSPTTPPIGCGRWEMWLNNVLSSSDVLANAEAKKRLSEFFNITF